MKPLFLAAVGLAVGALLTPAAAAPLSPVSPVADAPSLVEEVQAYRYHKQCYWTGSGWGYKHGAKVLVCRPYKPAGHGWVWHSEGSKHGWYHRQKKSWHHKW